MRIDVEARLATQAHVAAMNAAIEAHEETAARGLDRIVRRYVRQGVARFTTGRAVTAAAGDFDVPSWRMPIPVDLLDEAAMEVELEARARTYSDDVARTTTASMAANLGIEFNQSNALLEDVIAAQAGSRITTAPKDLVKVMMGSLQESYDKGHSIPKAARAMRDAGYAHSKSYAVRIARTELIGAVNAASLAQVQGATNLPYKTWMATGDNRTRPTHRAADSQVVPIDSTFVVGSARLEYPGDRNGPGEEVIMCRCTIGYTDEAYPGAGSPQRQAPGTIVEAEEATVSIPSTWTNPLGTEKKVKAQLRREAARIRRLSRDGNADEKRRVAAWRTYLTVAHHDMNRVMRGREPEWNTGTREQIERYNRDLSDLIESAGADLENDALLYRGGLLKDADTAIGMEITDPAFVSTTQSNLTARRFVGDVVTDAEAEQALSPVLFRIHAPQGSRILPGNTEELEWLLPPGSRFVVIREGAVSAGARVFDVVLLKPGQTARDVLGSIGGA